MDLALLFLLTFSSYQLKSHFLYSITIYIYIYIYMCVCVCVCVCYITILNMFRAVPCSSSGGRIVILQPLVSSLRGCNNTICPPEDEQGTARNMLRIVM